MRNKLKLDLIRETLLKEPNSNDKTLANRYKQILLENISKLMDETDKEHEELINLLE